ncbi:hypothetical protein DFJ63DRAFT_343231 [Scheffersomyces coipomensis]|uniref:uncharacterized protein n=1 Tax=Scheffersomyces coipomensis TaxID=1788519 RepID=UPI00315CE35B
MIVTNINLVKVSLSNIYYQMKTLIETIIFGILSIYVQRMNYYDFNNYTTSGLSSSFVTFEYVLATTMEFIVAVGYISNFYIKRRYYPELGVNNVAVESSNDESIEKENESELEDISLENNSIIKKEIV